MSKTAILAIDQGTTSSRAIIFSPRGDILAVKQREFTQHYPQKGWVEHDPEDIWNDTVWACQEALKDAGLNADDIAAIGITNQRETTLIWDRKTGNPVYNAIVWQDRRTADFCANLKSRGHEAVVREKTGLLLDPYFSGTKVRWILDHVEGAREKAEAGELAFGTVDSFLLWRLTGGKVHATDLTNAGRTLMFNIQTGEWDEELLDILDVPESLLPEVKDNACEFGTTDAEILGAPVMIGGMAGDQQAALIGQACFEEGMVKSTYGTGCFALMNIGKTFKTSKNGLLTTPAYSLNGEITYAIEGAIFIAGAAIQWLRDNLGLFPDSADSEKLATSVDDNNGVYFVPAFTGLGAPYWNPHARAAILGLTRESNAAHITRAALEAQAYQTLDLMDAMSNDSGHNIEIIRADGGLVANNFMCQFLSDMLSRPVEIPVIAETTALGAAYLAGLQAGIYKDLSDISAAWAIDRKFEPKMGSEEVDDLYAGWKQAVGRIM